MGFSTLRVFQFRNLKNDEYNISSREVFLIGDNGQGKTNCLEALYLLCYGSSFRTRNDLQMIRMRKTDSSVRGTYVSTEGISHDIEVVLRAKGAKEIRVDEKRIADRKEILFFIPCVVFSHDDLEYIVGSPAKKRRFFNQTLCMYDIRYLELLKNYKRVLFQRNSCLKQKNYQMLEIYDEQLAGYGFEIQHKRQEMTTLFNVNVKKYFSDISQLPGSIEIVYRPSWQQGTTAAASRQLLRDREEQDRLYQTTTAGPHRDQFFYFYDGADFCRIASTGQVRLLSIILRVAQASFFTEYTGKKPVLLLDDVLLELDRGKRELFIKSLPDYEQAFFTFLPDEEYVRYQKDGTLRLQVLDGKIEPWRELEIF